MLFMEKKLKKISLTSLRQLLSVRELRELQGGSDDVINDNSYVGCRCSDNNHRTITNKNSVDSCSCNCT